MIGTTYATGLFLMTPLSLGLAEQMVAFTELKWKFKAPLFIGDTIHIKQEIIEKIDSKPESNAGKVVYQVTVYNQKDEVVQIGEKRILIRKRPKE